MGCVKHDEPASGQKLRLRLRINYSDHCTILKVMHVPCNISIAYAPVTRPYICQRTPTYGDTSEKLGARFI